MTLILEKIDILAELGEAVYMFSERAASEGKFLLYEEPEMLSPVMGDVNRLRQVFVNIIDNALKYTDKGGTINVIAQEENLSLIHIFLIIGNGGFTGVEDFLNGRTAYAFARYAVVIYPPDTAVKGNRYHNSIRYALSHTSPDKIVVAVPFYGRVWGVDNLSLIHI